MSSSPLGTLPSCPSGAYPIPWGGLWVSLCPYWGTSPLEKYPQTGLLAFWSVWLWTRCFPCPTMPVSAAAGWEEVQRQACSDCSE